jgi:hypothetical protein
MKAFIDSATLVDIYRSHPPALAWLQSHANDRMGISSIAWLEMVRGAVDKQDQKRVMQFLQAFELIYLTLNDQVWAMKQFEIFRLSHNVGILDCLIAAPAYRLQLPLYTRNLKHFTPILGALAQQPY